MKNSGITCEVGYILWHNRTERDNAEEEMRKLHEYDLLSPKTALSRLVLFPGSELYKEMKADEICLCRLSPAAEQMYEKWERLLYPLRQIWTAASCTMPRMCCEAFLNKEKEDAFHKLEKCTEYIKEMTWQALSAGMMPDEGKCRDIRGELIALHIAGA